VALLSSKLLAGGLIKLMQVNKKADFSQYNVFRGTSKECNFIEIKLGAHW
jgi:hypothetical protein